jgi:hypothetical protein
MAALASVLIVKSDVDGPKAGFGDHLTDTAFTLPSNPR